MSTFLTSLLKKQKKQKQIGMEVDVQGPSGPKIETFEHSSNILFRNKVYKGYSGLITKIFSPKVLLSFGETIVRKDEYPDVKRGDMIKTKTYPFSAMVIDEFPILYVIQLETGETYNLSKKYLDRILKFRHINERGEEEYLTGILEKEEYTTDGIQYHFSVEEPSGTRSIVVKNSLNISEEIWKIKGTGNAQMDNKIGKLINVVPEQLVLSTSSSWFSPQLLGFTQKENELVVRKGEMKGKVGKVIQKDPKSFEIVIDISNKKIKKINNRIITEEDVFYKDILLKNGKWVEVKSILPNGRFLVTESRDSDVMEIGQSDINTFGAGFKIKAELEELVKSMGEMTFKGSDVVEPSEPFLEESQIPEDEIGADEEDEEDTEDTENVEDTEESEEPQKLVSSYKDIERIVKERESLSHEQNEIKKVLDGLFDYFVVNPQDINVLELVKTVEEVKEVAIRKLREKKFEDVFSKNDLKFLSVVVMFFYLVKRGELKSSRKTFNSILEKLVDGKYFKPIDVKNSSWFLLSPPQQKTKESFKEKVQSIISICTQLTKDVLGEIVEEIDYDYRMEAIPVSSKRQKSTDSQDSFVRSEFTSKRGTTVKYMGQPPMDYKGKPIKEKRSQPLYADYKRNVPLDTDAQMIWTGPQEKIIQILKSKLTAAIGDSRFEKYKELLQFALDHIDNIFIHIISLEKAAVTSQKKYLAYLKQIATILTTQFDKLETRQSMLRMRKTLQQTERKQKKLAVGEGIKRKFRGEDEVEADMDIALDEDIKLPQLPK